QPVILPSAQEIGPTERRPRTISRRIESYRFLGTDNTFLIPSRPQERCDDVRAVCERIELLSASQHGDRFIEPQERRAQSTVQIVRVGAAWTELERELEFPLGACPVEFADRLEVTHRATRGSQLRV